METLPSIEDLTAHDPQQVADSLGIPVIWTDHQATRRQRLHGANIPGQEHAFSSTHINEILDIVHDNGFNDCIFICETPRRTHLAAFLHFEVLESSVSA